MNRINQVYNPNQDLVMEALIALEVSMSEDGDCARDSKVIGYDHH